jgi:cytochrome c oxidase subunit 2
MALVLGACAPSGQEVSPYNPCVLLPQIAGPLFCQPDPQNTFAYNGHVSRTVGDLFWLTMWWGLAVWLVVTVLMIVAIWRFRRRPGHGVPTQVHGNTRFEVAWTIVPTLILVLVGVPSVQVLFELEDPPQSPLVVDVVGHQWWWEFHYRTDRTDEAENTVSRRYGINNIVTATDLHVPVGVPVKVYLRSADVQHSFWVPRLAGKTDLIPPRTNHMWFSAEQAGTYYAQCAELCGVQHAQMRFFVIAQPEAEFRAWVQAQQAPAAAPLPDAFTAGGCIACHAVDGTIARSTIGPNLTHVGSRTTLAGGILDNNPENLARWLRDPQEVKWGTKMLLPRKLSEDEVRALAAYLSSLR